MAEPSKRRRSSLLELARKSEFGVESINMEQKVDKIRETQQNLDLMRQALQNHERRSDEELDGMVAWFTQVRLFQLVDDPILRTMSNTVDYTKIDDDTVICNRGAPCNELFVIITGAVKIGDSSLGTCRKLEAGQTFGERGLLGHDLDEDEMGHERAVAYGGSVELAVVPKTTFDQHLRSILEMDAKFMKKHFNNSSTRDEIPVSLPSPRKGVTRSGKDLKKIMKKVYHVVCFFVRWNKLMNQRELTQLWKDHWRPKHALVDSLATVRESAAIEEDMPSLATESPKRLCIRAKGILKKPHPLRSKEEQAVLHRLVAQHWQLNLLGQSQRDVNVSPAMLSSYMTVQSLHRSEWIFSEGSDIQEFYIVLSGNCLLGSDKLGVGQPLGGPDTVSDETKWLKSCQCSRATPVEIAVIDLKFFIPYFNEMYKQQIWSCVYFISDLPCFSTWTRPKQMRLAYSMKSMTVREKVKVLTPDDEGKDEFVYIIKEGECRLMMYFQGTQITTLLKPGDIFGELAFLNKQGEPVRETVITTTKSKILKLPFKDWKNRIEDALDQLCYEQIVEQANAKLAAFETRIAAQKSVTLADSFLPKLTMRSENHNPTTAYHKILADTPNEMPSYLREDLLPSSAAPAVQVRKSTNRRGSWIKHTMNTSRSPAAFQPKTLTHAPLLGHGHGHGHGGHGGSLGAGGAGDTSSSSSSSSTNTRRTMPSYRAPAAAPMAPFDPRRTVGSPMAHKYKDFHRDLTEKISPVRRAPFTPSYRASADVQRPMSASKSRSLNPLGAGHSKKSAHATRFLVDAGVV